ncbi:MAG TPA: 5,10-methylenetetrahydrofolate reductase [Desulfobacteraceae bacterium]|nr:5,10-methylenetetrahydrofolate reductase [Desulfobacteraceae bacterium]
MGLQQKIEAKEFVILAEMEPPKGADVSRMVKNAQKVKGMVDAFVVPEMSNAVMRMSSLGGAMILKSKGLETVMQLNCRDRNRLALQADLLAANGCGISNVMVVKGEDPGLGDHHQARGVYDLDLPELLAVIDGLQHGRDMAGIELNGAPEFLVGSTVEAGARDKSPELILDDINRLGQAGTRFFITPPLFDLAAIEPVWKRVNREKTTVIPTVLLLKSLGMARYIARNVNHTFIPDTLIERIQGAPDKVRECIEIASETIRTLKKEGFGGVQIATIGWEDKLPEILKRI